MHYHLGKGCQLTLSLAVLIVSVLPITIFGRAAPNSDFRGTSRIASAGSPYYCNMGHNIGNIVLAVSNDATFGLYLRSSPQDCFTGERLYSCRYPKDTQTKYLYAGAFWIGAVLGRDTLVSTGAPGWSGSNYEFSPESAELGGRPTRRSTIDPAKPEFEGAVSEQDYVAVYYDTCLNCPGVTPDPVDNRPHRPLNLEVTQTSYAWSYSYADDFVLFDYGIKNIGTDRLRRVYLGIYCDADIHALSLMAGGWTDDITGFQRTIPVPDQLRPAWLDSIDIEVNMAWTADNDGDLNQNTFTVVPNITAMRIVRSPADVEELNVSFNWWISNGQPQLDFGPQTRAKQRDLGHGGMGTPSGDRNKFWFLTNGEFDYDQAKTASISADDSIWLPPPGDRKNQWATGMDTRYLLSFGPFDIEPGQTLPLTFAYVGGMDFHTDPNNFEYFAVNPAERWEDYYAGVDFTDLGLNAIWADWIYDTPGYDTDGDGDSGKCVTEKVFDPSSGDSIERKFWYKGDGVPDFVGAKPPSAPKVRVEPSVGRIRVIWNGTRSEHDRDAFTDSLDFEGYRVYFARDERSSSFSLLTSYDIDDYNRYDLVINPLDSSDVTWQLREDPRTLEEWRDEFGADWDPNDWPRHHPFVWSADTGEVVSYFTPQDFNQSILGNYHGAQTEIRKVDTTAPEPPLPYLQDPTRIPSDSFDIYCILWEDGGVVDTLFRFYEYEYTITDLLPTVPYWVNVTAFDYGSPKTNLPALETSRSVGAQITYALESADRVVAEGLDVFVYPNPYRLDGNYRARGFEGQGEKSDLPPDRTRLIHFANLPPECTIRIYSLDGDLVREIEHPSTLGNPPCEVKPNHECWDLITRNTQMVVSGLYYWVVESDTRTQIGKLAIIM